MVYFDSFIYVKQYTTHHSLSPLENPKNWFLLFSQFTDKTLEAEFIQAG
jgi:hypothetical protein